MNPDCKANGCQIAEHKGYRPCWETGQCQMLDDVLPGDKLNDEMNEENSNERSS